MNELNSTLKSSLSTLKKPSLSKALTVKTLRFSKDVINPREIVTKIVKHAKENGSMRSIAKKNDSSPENAHQLLMISGRSLRGTQDRGRSLQRRSGQRFHEAAETWQWSYNYFRDWDLGSDTMSGQGNSNN